MWDSRGKVKEVLRRRRYLLSVNRVQSTVLIGPRAPSRGRFETTNTVSELSPCYPPDPPPAQRPATLKRQGPDHLRFPTFLGIHLARGSSTTTSNNHPPLPGEQEEGATGGKSLAPFLGCLRLYACDSFVVLGTSRPGRRLSSNPRRSTAIPHIRLSPSAFSRLLCTFRDQQESASTPTSISKIATVATIEETGHGPSHRN